MGTDKENMVGIFFGQAAVETVVAEILVDFGVEAE